MDLKGLVGIPFLAGGRDPAVGLDCWGVVMETMKRFGTEVTDFKVSAFSSREIYEAFLSESPQRCERKEAPAAGLIVALANDWKAPGSVTHFGVCIGEGKFLHTRIKTKSCVDRLDHPILGQKIRGFYKWTG